MPDSQGPIEVQISSRPAGRVLGMAQASAALRIVLEPPETYDTAAALEALSALCALKDEGDLAAQPLLAPAPFGPALADLMRCACGLARHLLQAGGVPVFATEVITRAEPARQGRLRLDLRVPVVHHVRRGAFAEAYAAALRLMLPYGRPDPADRPDPKAAIDALYDSLIKPLRGATDYGKSTRFLMREAFARGIPVTHLSRGVFLLGTGARGRLMQRSATDGDPALSARIAGHKGHAQIILERLGVPVAEAVPVRDAEAAVAAARHLGWPVVLKPVDLDRGEGIAMDLTSEDTVRAAYAEAVRLSPNVMVQRRIPGDCHRLVAHRGHFVFGFTRHPAGLEADGERSVRAQVEAENALRRGRARHMEAMFLPFDAQAEAHLAGQGLTPESVPEKGRKVFLRHANVIAHAGFNEIVTDRVHPDNIALVERIARAFRFESVGIDLISTDPTRPWSETGAAVTELNHQPHIGENTARAYLERMFPEGRATIPVEAFVGGAAAMEAGRARLAELGAQGLRAALTSHDLTLEGAGEALALAGLAGLVARVEALVPDPALEALVLVVQTDEMLRTGLPLLGAVEVHEVDRDIRAADAPDRRVPKGAVAALVALLRAS